ncbi:DgyrCDS12010 [Dimorphilus gyrociliatus]|uniref:DgyrCDS12010 n=1 Tax=Dimorphilus gyrociliatus TaxID=2664684 RepID=A0A7I8W689_9ANNE|nr:DgyrCDS12010 [Dimorphilus gyrociliatus]
MSTYGFTLYGSSPARVGQVERGGSADAAGLEAGDCIVSVNGRNVSRSSATSVAILIKQAGDKLTLDIRRRTMSKSVEQASESGIGTDHSSQDISSEEQTAADRLFDCIAKFANQMVIGRKQFVESLKDEAFMDEKEHSQLFVNIEQVTTVSEKVYNEMKTNSIATVLADNCSKMRSVYARYCKNVRHAMTIASKLKRRRCVYMFLKNNDCGMSIFTFLQLPVQHVRDLILYSFEFLKTLKSDEERQTLVAALKELRKICEEVSQSPSAETRSLSSSCSSIDSEVAKLQNRLSVPSCIGEDLDIAKPGQFIVYTGDLLQVDARGYEQQRHVILLNNMILVTIARNDRIVVVCPPIKFPNIGKVNFSRSQPEFTITYSVPTTDGASTELVHFVAPSMEKLHAWRSILEHRLQRQLPAVSCSLEECCESDCCLCSDEECSSSISGEESVFVSSWI